MLSTNRRIHRIGIRLLALGSALCAVMPSSAPAQDLPLAEVAFTYRFSRPLVDEPKTRALPPVLHRRLTLTLHRVSVEQALRAITTQARLDLAYSRVVVPLSRRVSVHVEGGTVLDALRQVLGGVPLELWVTRNGKAALVPILDVAADTGRGMISGQVTSAKTGKGIPGADVWLERTHYRTSTDTIGHYRLVDVEAGNYALSIRQVGYSKASRRVSVKADRHDTLNVALEPVAAQLDELVATATGQQRRRDLGNAITTINADSVLRNAPVRNLTDLLQSRVPGLTVQHTSGAPGDPARLRFRGLGSIQRSNDPVVVVDGIRVYAAQAEGRSGNLTNAFGSRTPAPSPLDQIDPNIIEKIEVFKGSSAATLYGADAANGVIVITTKKGRPGPTRWHASVERGMTQTLGRYPMGYYPWGHQKFTPSGSSFCFLGDRNCARDSLTQFQALNDSRYTPLGQGQRTSLSLTASGGSQALTYSLTGTYGDETGLLKLPDFEVERFRATFNREAADWMRRPHQLKEWSVTSNVGARIGATADVSLLASVGRTQQQRSDLENRVIDLATTYIDSVNGLYYRNQYGNGGLLPDLLQDYYTRTTAASLAFTTQLGGNWRPRSWLDFSGQAGLNVIPRADERLLPAGLVSATDSGRFERGTGQSLVSTFTLQGNLRRPVGAGFLFLTNVGVDLTTTSTTDLAGQTMGLVPGTTTAADGAARYRVTTASASTSVFGWHIEPRLQGQRFSLSTGLRLDGGSAYGTRVTGLGGGGGLLKGLLALPKLNGSWVISEEPFFPFKSLFSSLRLRGAYGQAQVQPGPADRLRTYSYLLAGAASSAELQGLGNTKLRPERSTEFEGGFDADLLDSRVSVELTGYRKTQVDALMPVTLPPSLNGGLATVLMNIGTVRNTGVELVLRLTPVQSSVLGWSSELSYSHNHNELVALGEGVVPNREAGFVAGYPVGGRWAKPILGYADENHDGALQRNEIMVGDSSVFVGRLYPAYQMALHSTVTLLRGVVSVTGGLSYDAGMTQVDQLEIQNWVLTRALADPSTPLSQQAAALATSDYGRIRDISTLRFNELSVNYQAPVRVARFLRAQRLSLAVQGRNLALHSTYQGRDPDVNAWSPGEEIRDGGQLAQPRTWQLRVDLDY